MEEQSPAIQAALARSPNDETACSPARPMAQLPRPAAVHVAAAEEDGAAWEDALDVDDSDLRLSPTSSSRPLYPTAAVAPNTDKPSCPSPGQHIPGPQSAVEDAIRLRESGIQPVLGRADAQSADADFLRPPWLCALQFLDAGKDRVWERPGIKRIKADQELHRAPLVMGLVTSCKPNGLGDLCVTLKDPTDSIGASIHRKVLSEENVGQDISVGCVMILHKVAVFKPSRNASYLNITKGKVVKVVRKDCDPSFQQEISSDTMESQLHAKWIGDKPLGTSEATSIFIKMVPMTKASQVDDLYSSNTTNVHGTLGLNRSNVVPRYCTSQQSLKTANSQNPANWQERRGNLPTAERGETEGSANIRIRLLDHEKMMPSHKIPVADIPSDPNRTPDSSNRTSANKSSDSTYGHSHQSFNIPNTQSQPIPGDRSCSQASDTEKLSLPFNDELIMLPIRKKPKTNAALPDCFDVTMNTHIDTNGKGDSENNMHIDAHDMANPFHGRHSSIPKSDEHQQNELFAANRDTTQPTKGISATDADATNNRTLLSPSKRGMSVASVAGWTDWTDEQLSELFTDY